MSLISSFYKDVYFFLVVCNILTYFLIRMILKTQGQEKHGWNDKYSYVI